MTTKNNSNFPSLKWTRNTAKRDSTSTTQTPPAPDYGLLQGHKMDYFRVGVRSRKAMELHTTTNCLPCYSERVLF